MVRPRRNLQREPLDRDGGALAPFAHGQARLPVEPMDTLVIDLEPLALDQDVQSLFPRTLTQQCIVQLIRASMRYVAAKDMKAVAAALKCIYTSASIEDAARELDAFEEAWGGKYRAAVRVWRNAWDNVVPFFQFPPEIHANPTAGSLA